MSAYTISILVIFAVMIISMALAKFSVFFLYLGFASIAAFVAMFFVVDKKQKKNSDDIKRVIGDYISENYSDFTYEPDNGISFDEFFSLGIYKMEKTKYYYQKYNLVSGHTQTVPFRACNLDITYKVYNSENHKSHRDTLFKGIIIIYDTNFSCPETIIMKASPLVITEQSGEVPEFVQRLAFMNNSLFIDTDLKCKDMIGTLNKPASLYTTNMDFAMNFLTEERVNLLKKIPFTNIMIKGTQLVLCLDKDNARIVNQSVKDEEIKKVTFIDYNNDINTDEIRKNIKINFDMILSFPKDIGIE